MNTDNGTTFRTLVRAYQEAINQGDIDAVIALFHEDACINDEGILFQVRPFHEYEIGAQEQIILSDFTVEGDHITCFSHRINVLSRALDYEGKPLKMQFTIQGERISRLVIPPSDVQEAKRLYAISNPFFTWARENYPEQVSTMNTVTLEGGQTLATLASQWQALKHA